MTYCYRRNGKWNAALIAEAHTYWRDGCSVSWIADRMRMSRGDVAGRLYRDGLLGKKDPERERLRGENKREKTRPRPPWVPRPKPWPIVPPVTQETNIVPLQLKKPKSLDLSLFELTANGCRYITGRDVEFFYCGVEVDPDLCPGRGPYCPYHLIVMTTGTPKHADNDLQDAGREARAVSDDNQQDRSGQRGPDQLGMVARG